MISNKNLANTVGGKIFRPCDGCVHNPAQWFCAADDAFLCQSCDASVYSTNPLARRHERVGLKTSSFKPPITNFAPSWCIGFTKKARMPRNGKNGKNSNNRRGKSKETTGSSDPLVPENSNEENEEQGCLYRVPVSNQFIENSNENGSNLNGYFLPSEIELSEFSSLLGSGIEEESLSMEALGIFDCEKKESRIKVEDEKEKDFTAGNYVDVERELSYKLGFGFDEEESEVGGGGRIMEESGEGKTGEVRRKEEKQVLLRLDYEGIISAWANQRPPWTAGGRPELEPRERWHGSTGSCEIIHQPYGDRRITIGGHTTTSDEGRKARVSRYREKRRTRLFSKKIRYEIRKLNAETRPRMKGRFVKRTDLQIIDLNS